MSFCYVIFIHVAVCQDSYVWVIRMNRDLIKWRSQIPAFSKEVCTPPHRQASKDFKNKNKILKNDFTESHCSLELE